MKPRLVVLARLDGLCAEIEARKASGLANRAFVVSFRSPGARVLDASPQAVREGVRPGVPLWEARAAFPHLTVVLPDLVAYEEARRQAVAAMLTLTPQVRPMGMTGALLDVTASQRMCGGRAALLNRLRSGLERAVGIPPTLGVGPNPLVARIAAQLAECGETLEITAEDLAEALAPLPVSMLWVVKAEHRERLMHMGVRTFGQLQLIPSFLLEREFGPVGAVMFEAARGRDETMVPVYELGDPMLAVRHQMRLPRPTRERSVLRTALVALCGLVGRSLRQRRQAARRLRLALTLQDRTLLERVRTLPAATDADSDIVRHAEEMLRHVELGAGRCISLELAGMQLTSAPPARQLTLFGQGPRREWALAATKDRLVGRIASATTMELPAAQSAA